MESALSTSINGPLKTPSQDSPDSGANHLFAAEQEFCRCLERLSIWKRKHMPILDMRQGGDVLVWLFKGGVRARPLKDLYRGSRFSEPTMRLVLKALVDDGFIVIDRNPDDLRVRTVQITPKLVDALMTYLQLLRECAASYGSFESSSFGVTTIDTSYRAFKHTA
tara:strand:- start:1257 stop:1751 length:495 start_codon:yes stop_codon:yes gene_type:complete